MLRRGAPLCRGRTNLWSRRCCARWGHRPCSGPRLRRDPGRLGKARSDPDRAVAPRSARSRLTRTIPPRPLPGATTRAIATRIAARAVAPRTLPVTAARAVTLPVATRSVTLPAGPGTAMIAIGPVLVAARVHVDGTRMDTYRWRDPPRRGIVVDPSVAEASVVAPVGVAVVRIAVVVDVVGWNDRAAAQRQSDRSDAESDRSTQHGPPPCGRCGRTVRPFHHGNACEGLVADPPTQNCVTLCIRL